MLADKLDIWVDMYKLAILLVRYQNGERPRNDRKVQMPRYARYGIMNDAVKSVIRCLDIIYEANKDKRLRARCYDTVLECLFAVRTRVRIMGECGYLSDRQRTNIMSMLAKVGKQATALRNASQSSAATE